jgi:hypothetical protein
LCTAELRLLCKGLFNMRGLLTVGLDGLEN